MRIAIVVMMLLAAAGAATPTTVRPGPRRGGDPGAGHRRRARLLHPQPGRRGGAPDVDGGYRLVGLAPGRYTVTLVMAHEHIDVLLTVPADGEVIVPPVIVRDRCHSIAVAVRGDTKAPAAASWALRYGRNYRAAFGVRADESGWLSAAKLHRRR
jgi:hypothetical protein